MKHLRPSLLRLIGLLMVLLSALTLFSQVNALLLTPIGFELLTNLSYLLLFSIGGVQMLRLRLSGYRIALIWIALVAARVLMAFVPALVLEVRASGRPGTGFMIVAAGYLILIAVLLLLALFLLRPRSRDAFRRDDASLRSIAVVFAWLTPGLGRALVKSYWPGMLLYLVYFLAMSLRGSIALSFVSDHSAFKIGLGVLLWAAFALLDFTAVRPRRAASGSSRRK